MKRKIIYVFFVLILGIYFVACFYVYRHTTLLKAESVEDFYPKPDFSNAKIAKTSNGQLSVGVIYSGYDFEVKDGVLVAVKVLQNGFRKTELYPVNDFYLILRKSNFQQEKYRGYELLLLEQKSRGGTFKRLFAVDPISFEKIKGKTEIRES